MSAGRRTSGAGPAGGGGAADATEQLAFPIRRRAARVVVLAVVFVCAACGLVYELALVALGSVLVGSSITQTAIVLSVVLCSMGLGALAAKPLSRWPVEGFAAVELAIGVVGALSVPALYAAFAWLSVYTPAMVVAAVIIGALIGAEIPLLMALVQRIRAQDPGHAIADLSAADYVGALVGGLAFPFLLLPVFGLVHGSLLVGMVNVAAGWVVAGWLFGGQLSRRGRLVVTAATVAALAVLGGGAALADDFEVTARQRLYRSPIVVAERSEYQQIVVTAQPLRPGSGSDVRLYLDGDLQFSSVDEYRYHESLVHPAMAGPHARVLILGGGDGLAAREVLAYDDVDEVTLVDLDPAVTELASSDPRLVALNDHAFDDPRLDVVHADAFTWLRGAGAGSFDVIFADLPDPDVPATAKLYSQELYTLAAAHLAPDGRLAVQAGSPFFAPEAFWSIEATVAAAGLRTVPYHVDVPSFGDWGFVLASRDAPALRLPDELSHELHFLDGPTLAAAAVFPKDRRRDDVEVSTLLDPVILQYARMGWRLY